MPDGNKPNVVKFTDLPLTFGDENFVRLDPEHITSQTISNLRSMHNRHEAAFVELMVRRKTIEDDPNHTKPANSLRAYTVAQKVLEERRRDYAQVTHAAKENAAAVYERTMTVPNRPSDAIVAEYAAAARAMTLEDRRKFFGRMASEGSGRALAVLFHEASELCGMSPAEAAMYVDQYRYEKFGKEIAYLAAVDKALEIVTASARSFEKQVTGWFDEGQIRDTQVGGEAARRAEDGP